MLEVFTHTSEDTLQIQNRQNRDNIVELILDPYSDGDVSDCGQPVSGMYDN
jgi:hypothetical protein